MSKVKVEVLKAVVDGKGEGEQLTVDEKTAEHLESINYVKRVDEPKKRSKE